MAQARSIVVLHPTSYRESKVVGEHLRDGDVVLLDLTRLDGDDMHRLVDFVSGLVFGLQGNIDKVTAYVMLLVPPGVTAIDDESHLTGSFYNQS
ncbi:cell division protein SepF [Propioniciclava sp. MC1595]|uniref:cell division protein SepF n=1 Tax=unclassified Propioniciclava TaxID=2642922 RepID=UPI0016017228|nr:MULTISPECIES: cell division protein SepF [unclassified Propioniciclava]MBB1494740.1 cell division protein SepF [Propioniciclava sp. MC1595]MBB1502472.1 cell division protein SepF [Propioniciclava sp. MC1683]QTE25814.1 cell division protein SepF [Propioniciclava sp. MC1595]